MFGKEKSQDPYLKGIIPRATEDLFERCQNLAEDPNLEDIVAKCSFLEIYKEVRRARALIHQVFSQCG